MIVFILPKLTLSSLNRKQTLSNSPMLQPFKYYMIQGKAQTAQKKKASLVVKRDANSSAKTTLLESVKGMLYFMVLDSTNFSYGLGGLKTNYFHEQKKREEAKAFILGQAVQAGLSLKAHQDLIWFTYRKNIPIAPQIHSDMGWGCLIRVAQMTLAHALQRHFAATQKKVEKHYIITPFLQEKGCEFKYSIYRFVEMGKKLWLLSPGSWYSMTQVSTILEALHNQSPLKGSEHLIIKVYNETINIKALLQLFGMIPCKCMMRKADCYQCNQPNKCFNKSYNQNGVYAKKPQKHIMLIVTTKLGSRCISKNNFAFLLEIMSLPIFNGCLGGIPKQARFITGRYDQKISYLDPHYVCQAIDPMSLPKYMSIFQTREVRYMSREDLDPEMAFCFFITNPSDLQMLVETIDKIKSNEAFLKYEWQNFDDFEVMDQKEWRQPRLKERFQDLEDGGEMNRNHSMDSSFLFD